MLLQKSGGAAAGSRAHHFLPLLWKRERKKAFFSTDKNLEKGYGHFASLPHLLLGPLRNV